MTVSEINIAGWSAVVLENEHLAVTVLPAKGGEIHAILDRASGIDALLHAPWGPRTPSAAPAPGSAGTAFLHNYAGGWQELFPNTLDACTHAGRNHPFHGEAALLPWSIAAADAERLEIAVEVAGLRLSRVMQLDRHAPRLLLEGHVENAGVQERQFVWGHHCVLGPPFLQQGCRIQAPGKIVRTLGSQAQAARLAPAQQSNWPLASARDGSTVDLSEVLGPEADSDDDVFLAGLPHGLVSVENPDLGRTFELAWETRVFPWLLLWQSYGGAQRPLEGLYGLGIEPWVSPGNLACASAAGQAHSIAPGQTWRTALSASYR